MGKGVPNGVVAPRKEPAERMRVFARCKNNTPQKELARMYKYVLTAALIVGSTLPAFAEKGFYIVRGPDKKCVVVDVAPAATETTVTRVGKNVYVTREEADADMAVVCKPM
jgi:hypothetical protein